MTTGGLGGRRQQWVVVTLVTLAVAVVAASFGFGWWAAGPGAAGHTPPPVNRAEPHLIIEPSELPLAGGTIVLIEANPTSRAVTTGVGGEVERWNGRAWKDYRHYDSALDEWGGTGTLHALGETVEVAAIGLGAPAGGYGSKQWVTVPKLPAGFYRFGEDGSYGIMHVTAGASPGPPLRPAGRLLLDLPSVVDPGGRPELVVTPAIVDLQGANDVAARVGRWSGPARLERPQGSRWVRVPGEAELATAERSAPERVFAVDVPPLSPGAYRIVRAGDRAGEITGVFWVLPPR